MYDARLMIIALVLTHATSVRGDEAKPRVFFEKKSSEVVECQVSLDLGAKHTVEWRTSDVTLMRELFLDPLANAQSDREPAGWEILGSVTITRKDGSKEFFLVFDPWGHVKRGDTYLIADLRELHTAVRGGFENALDALQKLEIRRLEKEEPLITEKAN